MPAALFNIPDIQRTVTRPIAESIVNDIVKYMGLADIAEIKYTADVNTIPLTGSTIDSKDTTVQVNSKPRIWVKIAETMRDDNIITKASHEDNLPIFADKTIDVYVRPVYYDCDLSITLTSHFTSRSKSKEWHNRMLNKASVMRELYLHNLNYHMLLPPPVLTLIEQVYNMKEAVEGDNITFMQYLEKYFTPGLTTISDITGSLKTLAIRETQSRVVGMLDGGSLPEQPVYEDGLNVYVSEFTYKLTYNKPHSYLAHYPIMVHNQVLPIEFFSQVQTGRTRDYDGVPSLLYEGVMTYDSFLERKLHPNPDRTIHMPIEDEYEPDMRGMASSVILSALVTIDDGPLLNLRQLGDVVLDQDILDFMAKSEYPYLGHNYQSGITVLLYTNEKMMPSGSLTIDEHLNVTATYPLNKKQRHRVVVVLNTNPTLIMHRFFVRLHAFPRAIVKLLLAVNRGLEYYRVDDDLATASRFRSAKWDHLYRWYLSADRNRRDNDGKGDPRQMDIPAIKRSYVAPEGMTVQSSYILAKKSTDNDSPYPEPRYHPCHFIR